MRLGLSKDIEYCRNILIVLVVLEGGVDSGVDGRYVLTLVKMIMHGNDDDCDDDDTLGSCRQSDY